jgi:choice-of-anchor A domain-containing protein
MKIKSLSIVILLFVVLVGGLGFSREARAASFSDVNLGAAGPAGLNLGIFVTGPTQLRVNNNTYFDGNLGLASGASTYFTSSNTLTGNLYKDPGATVQPNISSKLDIKGSIIEQDMSQAVLDVKEAAANAASLTPDFTYGALGRSALTINPSYTHMNTLGGYDTVIFIDGDINITNPDKSLTINGRNNDFFIINVNGDVILRGGSTFTLSGGITPAQVLFNVEGTHDVTLTKLTSTLNGTFLAPNLGQEIILTKGTVNGAVIGYQISTNSGPQVFGDPYIDPSPVPLSPSVILLGSGLVGLGFLRWRRRGC